MYVKQVKREIPSVVRENIWGNNNRVGYVVVES